VIAPALLLAAVSLLPQGPELFAVRSTGEQTVVSADRTAVGAVEALRGLGSALGWRVDFATPALEGDLSQVSLDLSFDDQNPHAIAHLIAATGGADVVFDERAANPKISTVLHVVPRASAETESGRQRLLRRSMEWYRAFLSDEFRLDPLVAENGMEVRMHLGHLLLEQGDLEAAVRVFQEVNDADGTHRYVPLAMLKMAQANFALGKPDEAERLARDLSRMHPSRPETAAATVLLGRILIQLKRYDECVRAMRYSLLPLAQTPEVIDILLVSAEAETYRERPDYALNQMRMLADTHDFRELTEQQWLDYHYFRGFGAEGTGQLEEAMESLEIFLATGPADPRRGQALILLGRSYLALEKYLEARAAALQAVTYQNTLDDDWRKEARILQAKTALALGQKDRAFEDLEREVRRDPLHTPELIVFLIQSFLDDGRYQKAITAAELLTDTPGPWGDRARYLKILTLWRQCGSSELLDSFLVQALALAPAIADEELQRKAAELIGQAYGKRGDWDRAVDAYHGVLR
jgi:tetratricopeptide (TPR) repeat protein